MCVPSPAEKFGSGRRGVRVPEQPGGNIGCWWLHPCTEEHQGQTPTGHGPLTGERIGLSFSVPGNFRGAGSNSDPGPVFGRFGYDGPGRGRRVSCETVTARGGACGAVDASNDRKRPVTEEMGRSVACRVELGRPRVGAVRRPAGGGFVDEENDRAGSLSRSFRFRMTSPSTGTKETGQTGGQ